MKKGEVRVPIGVLAGAALLGLVAAKPASSVPGGQDERSLHGAASMKAQLTALAELGLPEEGITPPAGVDARVWTASIVPGNEPTAERVFLGRALYFDPRLSADGTVACATCHDVTRGFSDQRPVSEGIGGQLGRRNAPTTLNAALLTEQFWDGRATTVEHQAGMPVLNPIEMGFASEEAAVERIAAIPEYVAAFQKAYGRGVNYEDLRAAIGAFERTLIFLDAPFDRYLAGDAKAISAQAARGHELFVGKARCVACHPLNTANPLGSDNNYHNIGVAARNKDFESLAAKALKRLAEDPSESTLDELALSTDMSELGRFMVTKNRADIGSFKTEQLRNIGVTAPYMHDGSMQTLWDVMDHYNKGGEDNPYLDGGIEALALSDAEIDDLVAFLFTLTDVRLSGTNEKAMKAQREHAAKNRPFKDEALANRRVLGFERRVLGDSQETSQ
jgi:cytochrome c peroxidase